MAKYRNRTDVCRPVHKALRDFGYDNLTLQEVRDVLDAWCGGKREDDLPHGIIGMMAGRQFDEVEEARPGVLVQLIAD
jgi:hypothetical protein